MTKLNAALTPSLAASDTDSTAAWDSKRLNPRSSFVYVSPGVDALPNSKNNDCHLVVE